MRRLAPLLALLVLTSPLRAQDTVVDTGDGYAVVVVDGKARRLPLLKLDGPAPQPPGPRPDPRPDPITPPTPPAPPVEDKLGFVAAVKEVAPQVPAGLRVAGAKVYRATSSKIASGAYGDDIKGLNADHKQRLRDALGNEAAIAAFGPVSTVVNTRLGQLWNREITSIEEVGQAYAEVAGGLDP